MSETFAPDFSAVADAVAAKAKAQVQELHDLAKSMKASSGSGEAIREWLNASTDENIVKERELIAQFAAKLQERKAALEKIARTALVPAGIDPNKAAADFKEKRKVARVFLLQSKGMLESFGQDTSDLDAYLSNLPTASGTTALGTKSPEELTAIREWARANGHEVADKGRIAAAIVSEFEAANGITAPVEETEAE